MPAASSSQPVSEVSSSQPASSPCVSSKAESSSQQKQDSGTTQKKTTDSTKTSLKYSKFVTLTIDASKDDIGVIANGKSVGITSGDTVYTVLKRYCAQNGIGISAERSGYGMYISSIGGASQCDQCSQSGWIYFVNGTAPEKSCSLYKLSGGEKIKWVFTTDLGKTEG